MRLSFKPNLAAQALRYTVKRTSGMMFRRVMAVGYSVQDGWLNSKAGQALFAQECRLAGTVLERVFGDQIVQVGCWGPAGALLAEARTQATLIFSTRAADGGHALSQPDRLAIRTDSVDAVLLPHTLELSADPHAVLREVHRILRPDGKLMVLGFNPLSWWGLRHFLSVNGYPQGALRHISTRRICDWLHLLNLRVDDVKACYITAPSNSAVKLMQQTQCFANAYLVVARKETIPATVVRPRLGRRAALVQGLVNPTTRNVA